MTGQPFPTDDPLDELESLVHGLRETKQEDFFDHLAIINQKIDLIKEAVEKLCETTSGCLKTANCSSLTKTKKIN
jgi:hypothetical protein